MDFQGIVARLKAINCPGILKELDPGLASLADPLNPPKPKAPPKPAGDKPAPPPKPEPKAFGDDHLLVDPAHIIEICRLLRDDEQLKFDLLISNSGVDYSKDATNFGVVYHLLSTYHNHRFTVRADIPKEKPEIDTVESIWAAANWHERETYDFYGIIFKGHSDLRRILLGDDWEGWPLRKDYVFPTEYHGISCV